jgi:predicted TIM-barrel enzyme
VEGFVFAHVADEGLIESTAGSLLRYRRAISADNVRIFADIKKKHSAHAITADVDIVETASR